MFSKAYELSLSKQYVSHWSMVEGVRELLQNAIDSESPFEWGFKEGALYLYSKFSKLEPKTLLLGSSSKTDDAESIGSFGEGYKIAMLVLTRLGYDVTIYNGKTIWKPEFRFNTTYESDMLYIVSTKAKVINEGVTFKVAGLSDFDIAQITDTCLHMQKEIGEIKQTQYGRVLMSKPGRLYVGGLFICTTDLKYGYDIEPRHITLERDRQTVSHWNLRETTTKMWFDLDDLDLTIKLMEADIPDLADAEYTATGVVKEACYRHFIEKHPDAVIAKSQAELDELVTKGMTVTVYSGYYGNIVKSSSSYKDYVKNKKLDQTPQQELEEWFSCNKQHMRRHAIVAFKHLIRDSEGWRR